MGHDITDEDSPLEAGLAFAVAWDKAGGFIGREALARRRARALRAASSRSRSTTRSRCSITTSRSGEMGRSWVGPRRRVRPYAGRAVALGYVDAGEPGAARPLLLGGSYEVEIATARYGATRRAGPPTIPPGSGLGEPDEAAPQPASAAFPAAACPR